ncbi:hypothetical protein EVAR_53055_1 [Eumeta japonica]|uniref:Uncharacterized protein n=1 Tax=Eumeta variegata TaxID=151549 RepID=A0A4C1YX03_EUMVA|nr:hypothetical protein EVAR_53055_1 [Eumeta japonica]
MLKSVTAAFKVRPALNLGSRKKMVFMAHWSRTIKAAERRSPAAHLTHRAASCSGLGPKPPETFDCLASNWDFNKKSYDSLSIQRMYPILTFLLFYIDNRNAMSNKSSSSVIPHQQLMFRRKNKLTSALGSRNSDSVFRIRKMSVSGQP